MIQGLLSLHLITEGENHKEIFAKRNNNESATS